MFENNPYKLAENGKIYILYKIVSNPYTCRNYIV